MRRTPLVGLAITSSVLLLVVGCQQFRSEMTETIGHSREARLVFIATIIRTSVDPLAVPGVSGKSLSAQVNVVLEKPISVSLHPRDAVTVEVNDLSSFKDGEQVIFVAVPVNASSQHMSLKETSHRSLAMSASQESKTPPATVAPTRLSDFDLRSRIAAADTIIAGQVRSIRNIMTPRNRPLPGWTSEHSPLWREAIFRVDVVIKGPQRRQLVVRFPSSIDVMWYRSPKFKEGEQWTLLLKKDEVSGISQTVLVGTNIDAYTALEMDDVLARDQAERVRVLASAGPNGSSEGK